jgi:gas vesicle protein
MSEQGKQVAKVAAMFAGGAVIGVGIGLLFAPQSGTETRRDLGRYAKKTQVNVIRWGRSVRSGVQGILDRSRELVHRRETPPMVEAA